MQQCTENCGAVLLSFWLVLLSSLLGVVLHSSLLLLLAVLLSSLLLWRGTVFFLPPFGWYCFPQPPFGGAAVSHYLNEMKVDSKYFLVCLLRTQIDLKYVHPDFFMIIEVREKHHHTKGGRVNAAQPKGGAQSSTTQKVQKRPHHPKGGGRKAAPQSRRRGGGRSTTQKKEKERDAIPKEGRGEINTAHKDEGETAATPRRRGERQHHPNGEGMQHNPNGAGRRAAAPLNRG